MTVIQTGVMSPELYALVRDAETIQFWKAGIHAKVYAIKPWPVKTIVAHPVLEQVGREQIGGDKLVVAAEEGLTFKVQNGSATYQRIAETLQGWVCRLLDSTWSPIPPGVGPQ